MSVRPHVAVGAAFAVALAILAWRWMAHGDEPGIQVSVISTRDRVSSPVRTHKAPTVVEPEVVPPARAAERTPAPEPIAAPAPTPPLERPRRPARGKPAAKKTPPRAEPAAATRPAVPQAAPTAVPAEPAPPAATRLSIESNPYVYK